MNICPNCQSRDHHKGYSVIFMADTALIVDCECSCEPVNTAWIDPLNPGTDIIITGGRWADSYGVVAEYWLKPDLYIVALELNRQTLVKHIPSQYVKEVT